MRQLAISQFIVAVALREAMRRSASATLGGNSRLDLKSRLLRRSEVADGAGEEDCARAGFRDVEEERTVECNLYFLRGGFFRSR